MKKLWIVSFIGKNSDFFYIILKIIVGIPAFNEEKNIASIITKLNEITDTIIVCNDGSTDLTSKIAKKCGAELINHEKKILKSIYND